MLGIIAWIRPDGQKALVVVSGSGKMALGDPGAQPGESLKVGDMVFMSGISKDVSFFASGLRLVRADVRPGIVQDIAELGRASGVRASGVRATSKGQNVVSFFPRNAAPAIPPTARASRKLRPLLAAE